MARGTVKWFNSQKGFGFIQPQSGGKDVFVHISAVEKAGLPGLNEGQVIEYEEVSNKGKTSAETLKVQRGSWRFGRLIYLAPPLAGLFSRSAGFGQSGQPINSLQNPACRLFPQSTHARTVRATKCAFFL